MAVISPLRRLHQEAEAEILPYAPPGAPPQRAADLVMTYGELELEYAAIRKGCALIDQPHRGVIEVTGPDRLAFLNRMVTQELKGFEPFQARRSFWLNRKGRIDADLRLIELPDRLLLELDLHAVERTVQGLSAFIITEDLALKDITEQTHRLALHGPAAADVLASVTSPSPAHSGLPHLRDLAPDRALPLRFAAHELIVFRDDLTGETGLEMILPIDATTPLFQRLIEIAGYHDHEPPEATPSMQRLRPAGWHAINVARIEAGRPIYNIDFGPDSLPAETGVLNDRVSFTKGCYLGQEIVARMHARGHSKRQLVALKLAASDDAETGLSRLPETGAHVFPAITAADQPADAIGAITSAAISPMLSAAPIAFAQVKSEHTKPGLTLSVEIDESHVPGVVQPSLTFWSRR